MNKKIIVSLSLIVAVAAIAVTGTIAYFSDTETSSGNTFTAGSLDLKIDDQCSYNGEIVRECTWEMKDLDENDVFFNYDDVKPGDWGENTISIHVDDNPAWVCVEVSGLTNYDNGCTEPEAEDDATCDDPGEGDGELQDYLVFTIWDDNGAGVGGVACDNIQNGDEQTLVADAKADGGYWPIFDSSTTGTPLDPGVIACLGVMWSLPGATGNIVQSDSLEGTISFEAFQHRHQEQFLCDRQID